MLLELLREYEGELLLDAELLLLCEELPLEYEGELLREELLLE